MNDNNNDNVKRLMQKDQYQKEQDLYDDLVEVINKYHKETSIVSTIGVLQLIQDEVKKQAEYI